MRYVFKADFQALSNGYSGLFALALVLITGFEFSDIISDFLHEVTVKAQNRLIAKGGDPTTTDSILNVLSTNDQVKVDIKTK